MTCRTTLLLPILFCFATLTFCQDSDSELSRHSLAARQAQASGNLDLAAQEYLAVIKLEPGLAEARVNLGLVYFLQNRYRESAQELEKAILAKPGLRGASLFLGMDYVKLGEARRAVAPLKRAVSQEPTNKEARTWLSNALWDAGQQSDAIAELRQAERAFPSDPDILFLLGQAYRNEASQEMGRVLAAVGTPLYHQALGDIYREKQAWEPAEGHYRRALAKDPHCAGAHLGLAEIYSRQGKLDEARAELQTGAAARPVGNEYAGAASEFMRRDFDNARAHLDAFLAAHPGDLQAHYLMARTLHALALSALENMMATAPDAPRTHQLLAQTLAERDEDDKALAEYRKVEAATPMVGGLHYAIGSLLWKMKQNDRAMLEFQQELRLNPGHAEASASAGSLLLGEEQTDEAIPYLNRALQLRPGLMLAHRELGKALFQRGELRKAEQELKTALADDPEGNVHYVLAEVYRDSGRKAEAHAAFAEAQRIKMERDETEKNEKAGAGEP